MTRLVLLDSDYLISAFDSGKKEEIDITRRKKVEQMAADGETRFQITPLIFYEALRQCTNHVEMETLMKEFDYIVINEAHGRRAAEAFRFATAQGKKPSWLDKRSFDLVHCVCAEINEAEFISDDEHIPDIQKLLTASRPQ